MPHIVGKQTRKRYVCRTVVLLRPRAHVSGTAELSLRFRVRHVFIQSTRRNEKKFLGLEGVSFRRVDFHGQIMQASELFLMVPLNWQMPHPTPPPRLWKTIHLFLAENVIIIISVFLSTQLIYDTLLSILGQRSTLATYVPGIHVAVLLDVWARAAISFCEKYRCLLAQKSCVPSVGPDKNRRDMLEPQM